MNLVAQSLGVTDEKLLAEMIQVFGQPLSILQRNNLMETRGRSGGSGLEEDGKEKVAMKIAIEPIVQRLKRTL